ncbi:MAG: DAK2 domain-containing protein [Chloroflexi bacterium]|nr:DAK2 domain-containing protein [Chloroflexota bacterium]
MVSRWDGRAFLRVVEAAAARLQRDAAEVDALNVYPLPDGDTGRNMYQTMAAALSRARGTGPSLREVSAALAQGGLMGARGNSGVILSQMLRGFRDAFAHTDQAGPTELRDAFARARQNAFEAVERPADGTMLSLCAEVEERTPTDGEIVDVLRTAVDVGRDALDKTMEDNPLNRAAGVVDAGAYGVWLLLLGALGAVAGEQAAASITPPRLRRPGAKGAAFATATEVASWTGGHCVQYLVTSPTRKPEDLRREMVEAGADSVLVVGDESMIKVHAHATKPETIIAIGESAGAIEDQVIEDFDEMVAEHERATGIVLRSPPRKLATIAVVPGDGFAEIARSLYATPLLGGATMNPSVGELLKAIEDANAEEVVLLPNDKNVILAAREAARGTSAKVDVLETKSVAQGMAALVAFDPMRPHEEVVAAMRDAAEGAHGIEVTHATRDATIDGIAVRAGDAIALLDGKLVACGADAIDALTDAARRLEDVGIVTLYSGADAGEEDVERAAERLREVLPGAEVEVRRGGQPHYRYIVQAE